MEGRAAGFCEVSVWLLIALWWSLSVISKCFMTYAFISGFPDVCHLQDHVWSLIPRLKKETWSMAQKSSVLNALFFKYSVLSPVWKKKKKKVLHFHSLPASDESLLFRKWFYLLWISERWLMIFFQLRVIVNCTVPWTLSWQHIMGLLLIQCFFSSWMETDLMILNVSI